MPIPTKYLLSPNNQYVAIITDNINLIHEGVSLNSNENYGKGKEGLQTAHVWNSLHRN